MSGILRLESLTKGNTLKQGDLTVLKYKLSDSEGAELDIAGKPAVVRLMKSNFTFIAYEKEGLTITPDDTISFNINKVLPGGIYYLEVVVDDKYIFPSRSDEGKFIVDKSSLGAELTIIENAGIDAVVRKAVDLINSDPSLILDEESLVNEIIANTGIGSIDEYYEEFGNVLNEFNILKPEAEKAIQESHEALVKSESVQTQFNQVIIDGDSSVEAAQARVGTDGVAKATLKQRLDDEHNEVTAQLAQKANQSEVRKDTNIQPINVAEMDTETKQLFSGGAVAVVGVNSVGTENVKPKAITPEKLSYSELNRDYMELDITQGKNFLTEEGVVREVGRVELTGQMIDRLTVGQEVSGVSFSRGNFPNTAPWPSFDEKITKVVGEFDKGEISSTVEWDTIESISHHSKTSTLFFVYFEKDRFASTEQAREYYDENPIEVFYTLEERGLLPYPSNLSLNTKEIIKIKTQPEKELTAEFEELESQQGKNHLTEEGMIKEIGRVFLTGDMLGAISTGSNVQALRFNIRHFPDTITWLNKDVRSTTITGEFDKGEFYGSVWDDISKIGYHFKNVDTLFIVCEKDRFTLEQAREYLNNANIEVFYMLEKTELTPYPANMSKNTKEIIDLKIKVKELESKTENYIGSIYDHIPLNKVTELENQNVFELTYDGVVYCSPNLYILQKTADFETFEQVHQFANRLDYVFKLKNGSIFVVLDNGDIWLSDKNEENFQLLTAELGGQGHQTNTSRAYVYNNILLVGEYATPGTLGNRIFISTDYGATFKVSLLPEQVDRIDHIHSIVYDPYENLIWVATGDLTTSCRIFWSRNFGESWETHTTGQYRMTTIIPLPNYVLFGTDEPGIIGTFKYERQPEGVTPGNFIAYKDFAHVDAPGEYIFGWTSMPSINHIGRPYAYFGSRMSHDFTSVGVGKIGVWKTDGKDYFTLWEYEGGSEDKTPYGVSSVHGPDKYGRVMVYWIENRVDDGEIPHTIVFE